MLLSEGQMSDYKGAALMSPVMPKARELLADKATTPIGSAPLAKRGVAVCTPSKSNRKVAIPYDAVQAALENRKHVRAAQRLAAHPHPIRNPRQAVSLRSIR
jgi:putative transposase